MSGYYDELDRFDDPAHIDGWRHRLEQWLRFEIVRRGLNIDDDTTVVDLGCGTGRLYGYLAETGLAGYVGVDRRHSVIDRGRADFPQATFIRGELTERRVDEHGPYDVAVAIGTLVDGTNAVERRRQLEQLIERLDELGRRGWALCVLDQVELESNAIRRLEPSLRGATAGELQQLTARRGLEVVIDGTALPTDLFGFVVRDESTAVVRRRIAGEQAHQTVLERAAEIDDVDRAEFWLLAGRRDRAAELAATLDGDDPRASLIRERLSSEE